MNNYFVILEQLDGIRYMVLDKNRSNEYVDFIFQGNWLISLKENYLFDDKTKVKKVECKEYRIINYKNNEETRMYIYKNNKGINDFCLYNNGNTNIECSNKRNSQIVINNPYLKKDCFRIDGITLLPLINNIYINDRRCKNETKLKEGDKIECLGLIVYYYLDFMYINSFFVLNNLEKYQISKNSIRYNNFPKTFKPQVNYESKNELTIDELQPFEFIFNEQDLSFSQMAPGIVMSLSMMMVATFNAYNNIQEGRELLKIIPLVIMPIALFVSTIAIPLVDRIINKRKKKKRYKMEIKKYLSYLKSYYSKTKETIETYISNENKYSFETSLREKKNFYLNNNSYYFGTITLGNIKIKNAQSFPNDNKAELKEQFDRIKELFLQKVSMFLRVLEYKAICIYTSETDLIKKLNLLVLELAIKNNFNQIKIAIYSKKRLIFDYMAFLPHLFLNNHRLLFNSEYELVKLDNEELEVPVVVILLDITNYQFKNKNLHIIYLSSDRSSSYSDSNIIVDYYHTKGCLFDYKKNYFDYIDYDVNTKQLFYELSQYNDYLYRNKTRTFKELYETFNIKESYQEKSNNLKAIFAYNDDKTFSLDLHESKQGPHGLIGGTTGSGKSELITSLLLSLCIRYSPDFLNIILIDYKGGGIEDSLSYKGKRVPHIIASINNLSEASFERLIVAISNELKRRQRLFSCLSNLSYNPITNIDQYLNEDLGKYNLEKIPHLLIIVDEFAELKKNNHELIKELISFSRIGRSLGIHLILATQKPSGNIDEEIWSNARFKLALKVADVTDSQDIIKRKDAALIKNAGEFFLYVDGSINKATSLYSKADYYGKDNYEIELLNPNLTTELKKTKKGNKSISEASYFVKRIQEATKDLCIKTKPLDFNAPISLSIQNLKKKYKCKNNEIIIGEIDGYLNNKKGLLKVNKYESTLICSSREYEYINYINQYRDDRLIYIGSKKINCLPDSFIYSDEEDIQFIFETLMKNKIRVVLMVEDIECLFSYDDRYYDYLYKLIKRKNNLNITIILFTKRSQISYKILNSFENRYLIEANEKDDVVNIFGCRSLYKTKNFYMDERPISFVPPLLDKKIIHCSKECFIKRIPNIIKAENNRILIGYNTKTREKEYLEDNEIITFISNKNEELTKVQKLYGNNNFKYQKYDQSILRNNISNYIWIGEDIQNQNLFYMNNVNNIEEGEALFFKGNESIKLRLINYA